MTMYRKLTALVLSLSILIGILIFINHTKKPSADICRGLAAFCQIKTAAARLREAADFSANFLCE